MSDPFQGLTQDFETRLRALLTDLEVDGVIMRPYFGVRDPITQGKLWRQSRATSRVLWEINNLRTSGAPYLAECIEKAPATSGPWATNAIPGLSWHEYGEAMDCVWLKNGVEVWSEQLDGADNGYRRYMDRAASHGLTAIGLTMGKDFGHVQLDPHGSPLAKFNLREIDAMMKEKFGAGQQVSS